ncbi:unnamed protein product [Protopolystoma xenopodis]|uniref:Uncharacterized protein n=1 Tax=Protopolystoma xenopodis TaxID=117903 RepID=A0A448WBK4_9PLAT|nr:unnamed protein product [Protopolystoma xenopodis]
MYRLLPISKTIPVPRCVTEVDTEVDANANADFDANADIDVDGDANFDDDTYADSETVSMPIGLSMPNGSVLADRVDDDRSVDSRTIGPSARQRHSVSPQAPRGGALQTSLRFAPATMRLTLPLAPSCPLCPALPSLLSPLFSISSSPTFSLSRLLTLSALPQSPKLHEPLLTRPVCAIRCLRSNRALMLWTRLFTCVHAHFWANGPAPHLQTPIRPRPGTTRDNHHASPSTPYLEAGTTRVRLPPRLQPIYNVPALSPSLFLSRLTFRLLVAGPQHKRNNRHTQPNANARLHTHQIYTVSFSTPSRLSRQQH